MVRMENFYPPHDRLNELWQEIERCHLAFLEMEESQEKLEQRNKLEDYIHEYLCVTPHDQKFAFVETAEVLLKSARSKKDFSAYKASTGFNAIQLYAQNLLSQPWRKEYRQIQTYCGFYKHQIEANLVEAEIIFEALGYNCIGEGLMVLDGPICLDRVATISKDCLIAYVECQIQKMIWEEVSTTVKISWLDVLECRKEHVGGPEQAVKSIMYKQHQRQYQEHNRSYSQGSDPYSGNRCQGMASGVPVSSMSPVVPMNHSFPPLSSHHHVGLPAAPQEYFYTNGCCLNNSFAPYGPSYTYMPYAQPILKPHFNTNGYYYNNYLPPIPPTYAVPTGKLIEVESHNGTAYDLDKPKQRNIEPVHNELYKTKNNNEITANVIDRVSDKNDSQFEDWDYVYRNLESQGYSKDLGERGDVLSPKVPKDIKKVKATNLDEALNNLSVTDRPLKVNEALKKLERDKKTIASIEVSRVDKETSPPSSYENLTAGDEIKKQVSKTLSASPNPSYPKTKLLPRDKNPLLPAIQVATKTLEIRKPKDDKTPKKKEPMASPPEIKSPPSTAISSNKWQCKTCTFINDAGKDICDMCSKSRNATSEPTMEIGGAECAKCTLVNPKNLKVCEACGASLKDSPTYI